MHKWNNSNNYFFDWQQECFDIKDNLYNQFFIITSTDACTFPNKDSFNTFCLELDHAYIYLILLRQEEEHSQLFRQLGVKILVHLIHFVYFIHLYMNPSPKINKVLKRMWWKVLEFYGKLTDNNKQIFGFKSIKCPPTVSGLSDFESVLTLI